MVDFAGQFGVTLKAVTEVDRPSLDRAQRDVGQALGKKQPAGGVDLADKKVAQGVSRARLWAHSIDDVKSRLQTSWHLDGVGRAVDQLRAGRREIGDLAESAGKLLPPIGLAMGFGSLAGIGAMAESFGSRSGGLLRLSGRLGVPTGTLQRLQGAAELGGVPAEAANNALGQLVQTQRAAQLGLPEAAAAISAAKQIGLDLNQAPEKLLVDLVKKLPRYSALTQGKITDAFGVSDLLPVMQQGPAAFEAYMKAAERNRNLSDDQIRAGRELESAYAGATQSTLGLKDALGSQLAPTFVPLLKTWNEWMNDVKDSPSSLRLASAGFEVFGAAMGAALFVRLGLLTSRFIGLTWAVTGLAGALGGLATSGVGGVLAAYGFLAGKSLEQAKSPDFQSRFRDPSEGAVFGGGLAPGADWGTAWWRRNHPGNGGAAGGSKLQAPATGNVGSIPMPPDTGQSGTELAINNFGGLRRPGIVAGPVSGGFQSFATPQLGVQATLHLLQTYHDQHGLNTLRGIISRWAPPSENDTAKLIVDAASQTGFGADQPLNLHDAATLSAVAAAMIRNEVGVRGPSREMVDKVIGGLASGNAASGSDYQSLDTTHHVVIDLNGAPAGTRTRVASANGPSDLTLRTQMAFQQP